MWAPTTKSVNAEEAQWGQLFEAHDDTCYDHHMFQQEVTMRVISRDSPVPLVLLLPVLLLKLLVAVVNLPAPPPPPFDEPAFRSQLIPPVETILGLRINLVCNSVGNSDSSGLANANPMLCQQGIAHKALGETPLSGFCN